MTNTYPITVSTINGQQMCGVEGVALMIGVPADQIDPNAPMPPEWMEQAKIRADEAAEATGTRDLFDAWAYWARKDFDAEIRLVELPTKENNTDE
jgi:hypothetical protein